MEGRETPGMRTAGAKDAEDPDPRQRLNKTAADSHAGTDGPADGHANACASHRRGVLRVAYQRTRKDGATGVDDQTAAEYAANLEGNLQSLLDRFKSGSYRAPPVLRVEIPKHDGTRRPLGIPTFEDKVLQRAVVMVLGAVYEEDFLPCSFGFRPGRSAHGALAALREAVMDMRGSWIIELDIQGFFDSVDHGQMRAILERRVRDGVIRRMIDKWLKAGVQHGGVVRHPVQGAPQGGVISPLLANVYLHEVLDRWFEHDVRPRLAGAAQLVRYADDAVMIFAQEADARRVMNVLLIRSLSPNRWPAERQALEGRSRRTRRGGRNNPHRCDCQCEAVILAR